MVEVQLEPSQYKESLRRRRVCVTVVECAILCGSLRPSSSGPPSIFLDSRQGLEKALEWFAPTDVRAH